MIRNRMAFALVLVAFNGGLPVFAGGKELSTSSAAQINLGLDIYRQFCQRCHGTELRNSGASTFDLRQFPGDEQERFAESVSEGSGDMPPHGDILTREEIDLLFAYVVNIQATLQGQTP